jgi:phosphoglycerate dehydrogenase-like enzyme
VLVTFPDYDMQHPSIGGALTGAGLDVRLAPKRGPRSTAELIRLLDGAVGAIASTDPFTVDVMRAAPGLRVIARVGVGVDTVDVDAATSLGIQVVTTPGANDRSVADHTIGLMLAVLRLIPELDADVRAGGWNRTGTHAARQLAGCTVGLVGFGRIGTRVAARLAGFEVDLLVHDPLLPPDSPQASIPLDELLQRSDVVSIHCPLTASTRHLIDAEALAMMQPGAVIVNTARGEVIDEAALADALGTGRLGGAGIDAFADEPPIGSPLLTMPNVVLSPHNGGLSTVSIEDMTSRVTSNVIDVVAGGVATDLLNPGALEHLPA